MQLNGKTNKAIDIWNDTEKYISQWIEKMIGMKKRSKSVFKNQADRNTEEVEYCVISRR